MIKLGIMQGRLSVPLNGKIQSFPKLSWSDEFNYAQKLGLNRIEWLFDNDYKFDNPIFYAEEQKEIEELKHKYNIEVDSLCADYFRDNPLKNLKIIKKNGLYNDFQKLVETCNKVKIKVIMIPYVDYSKIDFRNEFNSIVDVLGSLTEFAGKSELTISLETNLDPERYRMLFKKVNVSNLRVNYDSGDSASLGFDMKEEFAKLSEYFVQIHIKDRNLGGSTVPLGNGDVNFDLLFQLIKEYSLEVPLILQTAREFEPYKNTQRNISYLNKYLLK